MAEVTKKEFEFDREGMKFPVSETLYYYYIFIDVSRFFDKK